MKKSILFLSALVAVCASVLSWYSWRISGNQRHDTEARGAVIGDKDHPDAAFQYRYAMLAGNQPGVDLLEKRREAVDYSNKMRRAAARLQKTTTAFWSPLGPGNIGGRIRSIIVHPTNGNTILIGSVSGGIWKTTDGGTTWKPKTDTLDILSINTIALDPTNSSVVYAGAGEGWANYDAVYGGGIYKSTDFGDTWALLSSTTGTALANFRNVMKLAFDPTGNVYAATKDYSYKYGPGAYTASGGLFKSTNGGTLWTKISSTTFATNYFNPCDVIPISSSVIVYAVGANGSTPGGIYRTTNGGANWSQVVSNLPTAGYRRIAMASDPGNSNNLFAVFESTDLTASGDAGLKGIYKSTDAGVNWAKLTSPPKITSTGNMSYMRDQGWYDNVIAVDPNNANNIYVGGVDLMKSANGGASWSQLTYWDSYYGTPAVHADHHSIAFDKNNANTVFSGNDGGIYKSTDGGAAWTMLNNGLEITQFYSGAVSRNGSTYYGGVQDNGHLKYDGAGTAWSAVYGGDGGYSAVDQTNDMIAYEEYVNLDMRKTTDGGATFNDCVSGLTDAKDKNICLFIAPFSMNPENSDVIIAGSDKVWITNNAAGTWTQSSDTLSTNETVSAVAVVNAAGNFVGLAGTTDGRIFKCTNLDPAAGLDSWTEITPPGNNGGWVRRLVVDLTDKNKIYATYGGYNTTAPLKSRHVWYSTNQGTTWSDLSTALPNVPVHSLAINPDSPSTVYIGTETGVFRSTNSGATWASFSNGMPWNVPTDELVIQKDTKAIFAYTHGRGVFVGSLVPTDVRNSASRTPVDFALSQNYPNPFNPATNIQFTVADARYVSLKVFDALGREVQTLVGEQKNPGRYSVTWDGSKSSSGVYYYRLTAGDYVETKRMVLVK